MKIVLAEDRSGKLVGERTFTSEVVRVGRDPALCHYFFTAEQWPMVSRQHAEFRLGEGRCLVADRNSRFGTFVNGQKIDAPVEVRVGTNVQLGAGGPILRVVSIEQTAVSNAAPVASELGRMETFRESKDVAPAATPPPVARYAYRSPVRPGAGNRRNAEPFFAEGVKAQKAGQLAQAVAAYATATRTDPGYFEAYYNQGLAAYEMADWKQCLAPYEFALALQPDSRDARYNFALALKQASYFLDAAEELLKLLKDNPNEARAHLSLANLYAQQLHNSKLAREHYLKLLELEPRHPQAGEIRYWLATNP